MKTSEIKLPPAISMSIISRSLDWEDPQAPKIAFQILLSGPGGQEVFKYSGGILAFLTDETRRTLSKKRMGGTTREQDAACAIIAGKRLKYNHEISNDVAVGGAQWLCDKAKPELAGLLYCLGSDADALDRDFEEWASDLGYNPDSRKDLALWEECRAQSRRYKKVVGPHFEAIREALQDY